MTTPKVLRGPKDLVQVTTEMTSEVKEFSWEIKNFPVVVALDQGLKDASFIFDAGDSIELKTQWRVYFNKTEDVIGIFLELLESPTEKTKIFGICRFQIADPLFHFPVMKDAPKPKDYKQGAWGQRSFIPSLKELLTSDLLANGNLLIRIQLTLYNEFQSKLKVQRVQPIRPLATNFWFLCSGSRLRVSKDLEKLLNSGEKANIMFLTKNGKTLNAHTLVLEARTPEFFAILQTFWSEDHDSFEIFVKLRDISYDAMKTILKVIYSGEPEDNWKEVIEELVYAIRKYKLTLLKEFCDNALAITCTNHNALNLLCLAQSHDLKIAEKEIRKYIENNIGKVLYGDKVDSVNSEK